ncbi:hypothetical protein BGX23_003047, partial [Mortierella sp. AD031]
MAFKPTTLIFLTIAIFMIVLSTQATTADAYALWCTCGESLTKTEAACHTAGGNWDGGSCGVVSRYINLHLISACKNL